MESRRMDRMDGTERERVYCSERCTRSVSARTEMKEWKIRRLNGEFSAQNIGKSSKLRALFNLVPRKKEKFIGNIKGNYRREIGDKRLKSEVFVDFSHADEHMI